MKFARDVGRIAELNISDVLSGVIRRETEICKDADSGRKYERTKAVSREAVFSKMWRGAGLTKVLPGDVTMKVYVADIPTASLDSVSVTGCFSVTIPRKSIRTFFAEGHDISLVPGTASAVADELLSEWLEQ